MAIEKEVLDQLLAGRAPQELFARDGLLDELKKALSERMLDAEQHALAMDITHLERRDLGDAQPRAIGD